MVDSFVVNGRPFSGVWSHVFKIENDQIIFWQEHYPVERMEAMFADPIRSLSRVLARLTERR